MTKTTEELKRAMWGQFKATVSALQSRHDKRYKLSRLENALEQYLEALRQDAASESQRLTETIRYNAVLSDAYTLQQQLTHAACVSERETWAENHELKGQVSELESANAIGFRTLMLLREERDELRNKLQAFEFANKSAGEFLTEARRKVKAQRQTIGQLKNERDNAKHALKVKDHKLQKALRELSELRGEIPGTSGQSSDEMLRKSICGALRKASEYSFVGLHEHYVGNCPHCGEGSL